MKSSMNGNRLFLPTIEIVENESLQGYLLRFMRANAVETDEFAMIAGLSKTGWIALCTRPELSITVAKLTGLSEADVRKRQIVPDPFKDDFLIIDGVSLPGSKVDLINRRRPDIFDGIYRVEWLLTETLEDQNGNPLKNICQCGKRRRWVDRMCCEMRVYAGT